MNGPEEQSASENFPAVHSKRCSLSAELVSGNVVVVFSVYVNEFVRDSECHSHVFSVVPIEGGGKCACFASRSSGVEVAGGELYSVSVFVTGTESP